MEMIYDRTIDNVNKIKELSKIRYQDMNAKQRQEWINNMKRGCYTYVDLNRVENAVKYVDTKIKKAGLQCDIQLGKVWTKNDIPTSQDMQRYINNIINIRKLGIVLKDTPKAPTRLNINYIEANNIEKILHDIDILLVNVASLFVYSGEIDSGGGFA